MFPLRRILSVHSVLVLAGVLVLIAAWKITAAAVSMEIVLPAPEVVLVETVGIIGSASFGEILVTTTLRALSAFLIGAVGAGILGGLAGRFDGVRALLSPLMSVVRATPVISVILLALIWFPTGVVPIVVALLMIVPIIYGNVMIGVQETPGELLEMAGLFRVPRRRMIRRIYIPAVRPYVAAALQTASGITWKVVVAAEVLSQPMLGIGAELQQARVLLATSGVFAWTILAILVSGVFHLLLSVVLGRDGGPRNRRRSHGRGRDRVRGPGEAARFGGAGGGAA